MSRSIIMKKIATIAMAILMMITATCTGTLSSIAPSFSISASAASYTVNDARKDLAIVKKHNYVISYYRSTNAKTVVKAVQRLTNYITGSKLAIDGIFGDATSSATKTLQRRNNITADGIVGREWEKAVEKCLNKLASKNTVKSSKGVKLDLNRAREYAKAHWSKSRRNPHYNYYAGNNCANYVSQILEYAGLKTDSGWHNAKYNYINCGGLQNYLYKTYNVKYDRNLNIKAGDIIVTNGDLGHVMFVMEVKNGKIIANANTNDRNQTTVNRSVIYGVIHTSVLF